MAKQQRRRQQKGGAVLALSPATIQGGGAVLALSPAPFQVEAIKGGSGAADYAISVFGNTDAQHAVAGSNVIQMQNPEATAVPVVTGGNNNRNNNNNQNNNNQIGGQGILTDVAVPALLLYANNTLKRKSFKKLRKSMRKSMRRRKSKRNTRGKR